MESESIKSEFFNDIKVTDNLLDNIISFSFLGKIIIKDAETYDLCIKHRQQKNSYFEVIIESGKREIGGTKIDEEDKEFIVLNMKKDIKYKISTYCGEVIINFPFYIMYDGKEAIIYYNYTMEDKTIENDEYAYEKINFNEKNIFVYYELKLLNCMGGCFRLLEQRNS